MADITFNPVAGVPFSGPLIMKDCTGTGGPYAPTSMGIAGFIPVLSLNAQSVVSTTGVMLDNQGVRNNHSLTVVATSGVTGGTVSLQGSQDNISWFQLAVTAALTPSAVTNVTANLTPVRFLRAFILTAITGGGTVSAYVASAG